MIIDDYDRRENELLNEILFGSKKIFNTRTREFTIVFCDFNIGYDEKRFSSARRFTLKVADPKMDVFEESNNIRITKEMLDGRHGMYSLFFEYLLTNGVFFDNRYYLGQMNSDVVFSIAGTLPDIRLKNSGKSLKILNEYYTPGLKIVFMAGGNASLFIEQDIEIIPGKYSNFILKNDHIYKLNEAVPADFAEKLFRGTEINLEAESDYAKKVLNYLQRYFEVEVYRGVEQNAQKIEIPRQKIEYSFEFSEGNNELLQFDLVFHCESLRISTDELKKVIKDNEYYVNTEVGYVEPANRHEIDELLTFLDKISVLNEEGRYAINKYDTLELINTIDNSKLTGNSYIYELSHELDAGTLVKDFHIAGQVKNILREYQIEGLKWMLFLRKYGFSGILADDMGTGKTLQVLSLIKTIDLEKTSLVICPKTLIHNWESEAAKFFPEMRTLVISGNIEERHRAISDSNKYDLVITSYPVIQKDASNYKDIWFEYIILDESQYIKNPYTRTARSVKKLNGKNRLCLTGTPVENSVFDLWSMFDFLMPGFLGSISEFKKMYSDRNSHVKLSLKVKPFILRRTKADVLKELPSLVEQISEASLTKRQLAVYAAILERIRGNIFEMVEARGYEKSRMQILAGLTRLRQICNHPGLVNERYLDMKNISGKYDLFCELLDECIKGGHKVLVFSQFTKMLDIMGNHIDEINVPYVRLDGASTKRDEIIRRFNEDDTINIFLISMRAGGFGLNLTKADTVILYDPWWNPMVEAQARDRAYRMGQTKNVNVYRLITKGTIEEKIQELKQKKSAIFDEVVGASKDMFDKLSWDELKDILLQ